MHARVLDAPGEPPTDHGREVAKGTEMRLLILGFIAFVLMNGAVGGVVGAQAPVVMDAPAPASGQVGYAPARSYDEDRRYELQESSRRSRNALIGTSASAAVGAALLFPGLARQCEVISYSAYDEQLHCTRAGRILTGFGWPLFVGGVTGAVITGIMFGVRKGKLRRLEDRMAYEKSRSIRWDPASSRFVF